MVVKRKWKVVSGTMAAGAILAPATAMARDGLPALNDVVPYVSDSLTNEDASFYQRLTEGLPVTFDFQSELSAADESIADETTAPTVASAASEGEEQTIASEATAASETSAGDEASDGADSAGDEESGGDSVPSADD